MNFAADGKIPSGGKSPRKCIYSVPAQETAKHCAKFGRSPVNDVAAVTKPRRETRFITALTSLIGVQPNFARCLAVSWAGTLYIHFRRLLPPNRILPGAILTLRPSLAFSYIGSVTARHSSCGRQLNLAAWYKEWNCGTVAEGATYIRLGGHHLGHLSS